MRLLTLIKYRSEINVDELLNNKGLELTAFIVLEIPRMLKKVRGKNRAFGQVFLSCGTERDRHNQRQALFGATSKNIRWTLQQKST